MIERMKTTLALVLASTALSSGIAMAAQERVGITSAVNPAATGTPPGGEAQPMIVGRDVIFKERIVTTGEGQAQLLFLDQSSLLIGPNSTVVIDEFVFDPNTNKGNMVATLTQGSFRYIGGKLSKQGNATLRTPVATMGIRGSDAVVSYNAPTLHMEAFNLNGNATVQNGNGSTPLPTGFGTTVTGSSSPTSPTNITAGLIALLNKSFEGQAGKTAGANTVPTNDHVSNSGLSQTVETNQLNNINPGAGGNAGGSNNVSPPTVADDPSLTTRNAQLPQQPPAPEAAPTAPTVMNGYVGGLATNSANGANPYKIINDKPTDLEISTPAAPASNAPVLVKLTFRGADQQNLTSASIELGDPLNSTSPTQSQVIDANNFIAVQQASLAAKKGSIEGLDATAIGVLTAANAAGSPVMPSLCTCEYITWGLWVAQLETAGPGSRLVTVPLATFVAGQLPNINDPTPQGSASFQGTAFGFVQDGAATRQATGVFTNNYNFAQKTGNVFLQNFDANKNLSGTVAAGADWRNYSGTWSSGSSGAFTGGVNGSFYGNRDAAGNLFPLNQPKETAGNFTVKGTNYQASGVFGARVQHVPAN